MHVGMIFAPSASPRSSSLRSVRAAVTRITHRVSATVAEFRTPMVQQTAPVVVDVEPAEPFTPDDMPALADIEQAAASYFRAGDAARAADRQKRASKKILTRLMPGRYGDWEIALESSGRSVADLDEIKRIFKAHGLGSIPVKSSTPSLKVRRVQVDLGAEAIEHELNALAGAR